MTPDFRILVGAESAGERMDRFLALHTGLTRSQVQRLIDEGLVTSAGRPVRSNQKTKTGDDIRLVRPSPVSDELVPEARPLDILFEDDHLIFVNKPPALVVYPAAGHASGTLLNALRHHCDRLASVGGPIRPGVVHRLDKDTSGVMVFAKTDRAYYGLQRQFRDRTIRRQYVALVYGPLKQEEGRIDAPLGRSESDRKKISTRARRKKEAVTLWKRLEPFPEATLVQVRLLTGRTHQIRVHFASIGHPVLGDRTYGRKISVGSVMFPRQMLHAELLGVEHPETGRFVEYRAAIPDDMRRAMEELRQSARS